LHGPEKIWGSGRVPGGSRGRAKGEKGALSNVVNQCPECGGGWRGEGRHQMLGEADPVTSGRKDWARVIDSPDAGIAREVNDIRGWVISHEGTGVVWGAEPTSQGHEKTLPRAAEDLEEDRVPGRPVSR